MKYGDKIRQNRCRWGHSNCAKEPGGQCRNYPSMQNEIEHIGCDFACWLKQRPYDEDNIIATAEADRIIKHANILLDKDDLRDELYGAIVTDEADRDEVDMENEED